MKKDYNGSDPKRGDLIPYRLKGVNTPLLYNDIQVVPKNVDVVSAKTLNITGLTEE